MLTALPEVFRFSRECCMVMYGVGIVLPLVEVDHIAAAYGRQALSGYVLETGVTVLEDRGDRLLRDERVRQAPLGG